MATTYTSIASNKRRSFVLIVLFIGIVMLIGWAFDTAYKGDASFLVLAAFVSIVMTLVSFYAGDKIALATSGAQPVTREQAPYVVRMVENLAITAGLPMPRVFVIQDPTMNAFATGRDPKHASVAVTTGAMQGLENEELEGVLAHELSHVGNHDTRLMMLVAVLVGIIVILADLFWRGRWLGLGGRRRNDSGGAGGVLMIIGLVLLIFAPIAAQLMKFAISRRREFLADASGALLTRYPEGLAKALEKIQATNVRPMARASDATAHLYIANPFGTRVSRLHGLFATHPPMAERVKELRAMGGAAAGQ